MANFDSEKKQDSNHMPTVRCLCGAELLVVPNVEAMSKAIEAHIETHIQGIKDPKKAVEEAEHIRDYLITQVLEKISHTEQ
jgi:hypothetical protein